jgi:hypothetical protein
MRNGAGFAWKPAPFVPREPSRVYFVRTTERRIVPPIACAALAPRV